MVDYHIHGNFCGHGAGELEEYVLEALERGIIEMGFSAHLPLVKEPDPYHAMLEDELPDYVRLVEYLRKKYIGKITIKLGIEADYFPGYEAETRSLLDSFPFDYVLGAVHFIGDWHFTSRAGLDRYSTEDPDEAFFIYFGLLKDMIKSGIFDIVAHPDAIKHKGFSPSESLDGTYLDVARLIVKRGMAVEVNTAGIRRGKGSVYPDEAFLKKCVVEGIPLTLGSDAHSPDDVGRDFGEALLLMSGLGIKEIATYKDRRLIKLPLSDLWCHPS